MESPNPLQAAQDAIARALAQASDLRSSVSAIASAAEKGQLEQLLRSLAEARAEVEAGCQLVAEQSARIRELSVVTLNSTLRSF